MLGPAEVALGHDDQEPDDIDPRYLAMTPEERTKAVADHEFGWDNESPARTVHVGQFSAEWRPVSNGEYRAFWEGNGKVRDMPTSWVEVDGEIKVGSVSSLAGPRADLGQRRYVHCLGL